MGNLKNEANKTEAKSQIKQNQRNKAKHNTKLVVIREEFSQKEKQIR